MNLFMKEKSLKNATFVMLYKDFMPLHILLKQTIMEFLEN
jgi:hypothetical protein